MRGDLMRMVLHGVASEVAISQGSCEGVGGGPAIVVVPDDGAFPRSLAHSSATAAALVYAMGQLGPVGPAAEPPKAKTPKPDVAPAHWSLSDRKKHLRQIRHRKAQAARLVKRLKSRKAQAFSFKSDEGTMELNGRSFPVRNVKFEWAKDASVREAHK